MHATSEMFARMEFSNSVQVLVIIEPYIYCSALSILLGILTRTTEQQENRLHNEN